MANAYTKAFDAKIEAMKLKTDTRASNMKKVHDLRALVAKEKLAKILRAADVKAQVFETALYASEKLVKFAHHAIEENIDFSKVNANAFAAFKTAIQARNANVTLTKKMIEAAICADMRNHVAISEDQRACIFTRANSVALATVDAQSQQCVDFLKKLKVISEVSKQVYTVNDSELTQALAEKFNMKLEEIAA